MTDLRALLLCHGPTPSLTFTHTRAHTCTYTEQGDAHASLHSGPASTGARCHQPRRGGIPWQAEDKRGSAPSPRGYPTLLCGPDCSPPGPFLPAPSVKGGLKLTLGQPTHSPAAVMHQEAPAWWSARGEGRRALIRKELGSPPGREELKALHEGWNGPQSPASGGWAGLGWAGQLAPGVESCGCQRAPRYRL